MFIPHPTQTFIRLVHLQHRCWTHGHKAWARAISDRLHDMAPTLNIPRS